jgi:hypothetical protein
MSMLEREPPGCPLAAIAVISTALSLLFLAVSSRIDACSELISAALKFRRDEIFSASHIFCAPLVMLTLPFRTNTKYLTVHEIILSLRIPY